jgi:cobalt-zinc-cadmium efflux system outer membrane protein
LFRALHFREQAAENRLSLERSAKYPDVTVGLTVGREGPGTARETLTTLSVSVPIPLFKRNAGAIGRASSDLTQSRIEKQVAVRDTEAQVRSLWQRLESLQIRVDRLNSAVLPKLDENQRLSTISYKTGELGLMQLLLVNRQLLDGRRDYLDALAEYAQTRIELEQTAGFLTAAVKP